MQPGGRPGATIASILLDAEAAAPDRPALLGDDYALSFSDIGDRSRRVAGFLAGRGIRPGDRVALLLPNGVAFTAAHYALALIGAVIVPINPRLGTAQVGHALRKASAACLIGEDLAGAPAHPEFVVLAEAGGGALRIGAGPHPRPLGEVSPLEVPHHVAPTDPALLFFTSGTTGTPKGVLLRHEQVLFGVDAWARRWAFDEHVISLMAAPFFHVVYNPLVLGAHRRRGASVVQSNLAIPAVCQAVERHRVTALMSTPAFMQQLASGRWTGRHDLGSLDTIIYGAAPTPPAVVRALGERFSGAARYNCYGMTETSSALTCLGEAEIAGREGSVGRPHPGVTIGILDAEAREQPVGERGEVCARGPNVIARYFEAPEIDALRFHGSWLRTGDVGYLDEQGYLYLLDRLDDQINIAGEKFYPFQIEEVLLAGPCVSEAAAVGVPDTLKGQVVNAFVVAETGCAVDVEALRRRCVEQLPACAVPRRISVLEQIPRNATGKVARRDLVALAES